MKGAAAGAGIDLLTGGLSLGAATAIGLAMTAALLGAATSVNRASDRAVEGRIVEKVPDVVGND